MTILCNVTSDSHTAAARDLHSEPILEDRIGRVVRVHILMIGQEARWEVTESWTFTGLVSVGSHEEVAHQIRRHMCTRFMVRQQLKGAIPIPARMYLRSGEGAPLMAGTVAA